jgi:hypothetical protein
LKSNRRWLTVVQSEERCRVRTWRLQLTRRLWNRVGVERALQTSLVFFAGWI